MAGVIARTSSRIQFRNQRLEMAPKVIDEVGTSKESLLRQRKNAVADAAEPFGPEKGVSSGIRDGT